jgi:hypothetical protein
MFLSELIALTPCEGCNFNIGKKCWHYGEITEAQQSEMALIGCEHYHPWRTIHPPQPCDHFRTFDRLISESVTITENGQMISGWIQEHKALVHCMSILFHDDR